MAEYIEREKAQEAIRNYCLGAAEDGEMMLDTVDTSAYLIGAIGYIPAADAVEVVRCCDCAHLFVFNTERVYAVCTRTGMVFYPFEVDTREHFCGLGERKED